MLVDQFFDPETVFGGDDADEGACIFQCEQYGLGFKEEHRIYRHVRIRLFSVFVFETFQLVGICHTGQDRKRFFQGLSDGAFDGFIGHVVIAVLIEHIAEASDDAARRVCERVIKVKEISCVTHCRFLWQR